MPQKWKMATYYDDSNGGADDKDCDDNAGDGNSGKRLRAELQVEESQVRRSLRNGKGTGGRIVQMQNFERIQVDGPSRLTSKSRRLLDLDVATQHEPVNPMAPSSSAQPYLRPKPTIKSNHPGLQGVSPTQSSCYDSHTGQPAFTLARPGQQFGFRLPSPGRDNPEESHSRPPSVPPSSHVASIFSGETSRASTAPTSRASSVCSSNLGDAFARRHSSHLQRLALASQSGVEAPARLSWVLQQPEGTVESSSRMRASGKIGSALPRPHAPTENIPSAAALFDESMDESDIRPARPVGFRAIPSEIGSAQSRPRAPAKDIPSAASLFNELIDESDVRPADATDLYTGEGGLSAVPHTTETASASALFDEASRGDGVATAGLSSPPPRLLGLRCTAAPLPRDVHRGDSIFMSNDLDLDIDEASPSDDDRVAEAALRGGSVRPDAPTLGEFGGSDITHFAEGDTNGQREDVVVIHRRRNRAPRLPSVSQLAVVRHQQRAISAPSGVDNTPISSHREISHPPEATQSNCHPGVNNARRTAISSDCTDPSQLQFYEPAVRDILERAKQFSHCDAAAVNAFPHRAEFNKIAIEYVEEAIEERRSRSLLVPDGWWPQYNSDICKLLWEDLGNWRSALRKKARTFATQRYQWDVENRRDINQEIAKGLLADNGVFLRDGVDSEGKTNNLAHPALAGLVIDFFYGGDKSVGKQFPEVFGKEVPRVSVAMAATALNVVLDEIASPQGEVNFRVATYSPVYLEMLGLMKKCDTSPVHAAKTKALRCKWAEMGSGSVSEAQGLKVATSGFDVVLD